MNVTLEMSEEELVEVAQLLARSRRDAKFLASSPTLTTEEKQLATSSTFDAVKAIRDRLGCSITAAKRLVDGQK